MKISLVQSSIAWLDATKNRAAAERWLDECSGSNMVVFPEMFTTGFTLEPDSCAEYNLETLGWMISEATKRGIAICGSVAVGEGEGFYNRLYFVRPYGSHVKYDKRHLFTFAGEHNSFAAGVERVIVELEGVRILLLICYDLRFPVWSRNRGDYDMIICIAAWPEQRRLAWDALLRARAIENLCYVCGVNIVGADPSAHYSGGTAAIGFMGEALSLVEDNVEGVATFELDIEALRAFRVKFPALEDGDKFEL
ncbi:MAG: nitrilase-related carbon-nitrogen hydrolase [Rikenellaceae bacterium]